MDVVSLERIDSFPYRHRVADLMTTPVVTVAPSVTVADAARVMSERSVSSVLVVNDSGLVGILTERDVLRLVAADAGRLANVVAREMSTPVHAIAADVMIYRALARLARLGVRHLPVLDEENRPVGILTARALLKQRTQLALTLGDEIELAVDAKALLAARQKLPALAAALRHEDVAGIQVSAVLAGVICDLTRRAAELALTDMLAEGLGAPPAPWCLLVLGSAGRGESLLTADQDNALIHEGGPETDSWFAAFGERMNRLLDAAGIPLCKGGVMAGNAAFRRSAADWRTAIDAWVRRPHPEALLNVDIFYDFVPVLGERSLAHALRRHAVEAAAASPLFLRLLTDSTPNGGNVVGWFGQLRTEQGRIDVKRNGLFPLVATARAMALAWRSAATATDTRLTEAAARGALSPDTASDLIAARSMLVEALLDQQLADIETGMEPSNRLDPKRLRRSALKKLRAALETAAGAPDEAQASLGNRDTLT